MINESNLSPTGPINVFLRMIFGFKRLRVKPTAWLIEHEHGLWLKGHTGRSLLETPFSRD
jgi:hypothetical protein